jgi:peptidoglycan hydrolase-like protein with peptidoglycan-binding domain
MILNQPNAVLTARTSALIPLLQPGSQGTDVSQLQVNLAQLGFYNEPVDGLYGATTTQAVRSFQQKQGLPVDGIAGPQTQQVLALAISPQDLFSALVILPPNSLTFTPLLVAPPSSPPSAWWLLVMPLIPLVGGGLTYLQHQQQAKRAARRKHRKPPW